MKKLVILLTLSFCSISMVYSQTWEELISISFEYYNKGDSIRAIEYAEKAKVLVENDFGKNHKNYIASLESLAATYSILHYYTKAEPLYIESLNKYKELFGTDNSDYARLLSQLAFLYSEMGNYTKAEPLYIEASAILKKVLGSDHPDYAQSLVDLGKLYSNINNYKEAEIFDKEASAIFKKTLGEDNPDYASSLNNLAIVYYITGNYSKADPIFNEVLNIRKKVLGIDHPNYASSLNNLGQLYDKIGNYSRAELLYKEALNIRKRVLGQHDPDYAQSLNNLATLYSTIGDYSKAESFFIEALTLKKELFGPDDTEYALTLNNLAVLYSEIGNYEKADSLSIESLNIRKKTLGINHPDYAKSLDNLASLSTERGNYEKAEQLYIEASVILKKALGSEHPDYALSLNNLGFLYITIGDYSSAEKCLIGSLNIKKIVLGIDHQGYAGSLSNLALLYHEMGNYNKAEQLYIEASAILKKALGPYHNSYATVLSNLAVLYGRLNNYTKVEQLYLEVLNITRESLGTDHKSYALSLHNLAVLYSDMGEYSKAEQLFFEVLNIQEKIHDRDHPDYVLLLNNLAILYDNMGNFSKAELHYKEALNIGKRVFGQNHPNYALPLYNLAQLYYDNGNYEKAEPLFFQANENLNIQINRTFGFLSEKEKEQFLNNKINFFSEIYYSFILKRKEHNPSLTAISFNNELAHKGMLLLSNTALRKAVYGSDDADLIVTYDRFNDIHKMLSELYSKPIIERKENIDSLENIANTLEKDLIIEWQALPGVENLTSLTKVKWHNVQEALKPGEAAIEFVNFNYYDKRWTDSIFYCALVLRKDYQYPKMIYLFEEKELQEFISKPQATSSAYYITQLYNHKPDLPSVKNQSSSKNLLYSLVWQPIDSLLKDINTIYLAPSGLLNKVAFNAIPTTDTTLLSDKYQLNLVSSTRILTQEDRKVISFSGNYNATLYGGIEYEMDSTEMVTLARRYQKSDNVLFTPKSINIPEEDRGTTWSYLPGTLTEVSNIEKLFKTKRVTYSLYIGKNATEESFKHLTDNKKSPEIIHIATHGFFFPEIKPKADKIERVVSLGESSNELAFTYSENPLFRSGILLAGANRTWNNSKPFAGVEDGILTAYEVSNMNLRNTKLIVLSACETGLGDIKGSEGVYGLQRAFKMAGVKYIVMSLWQVPDYQTSELMQLFYINCLNGMTIKEGFRTAQQTMRKKYDPFYWAAFVLIE